MKMNSAMRKDADVHAEKPDVIGKYEVARQSAEKAKI